MVSQMASIINLDWTISQAAKFCHLIIRQFFFVMFVVLSSSLTSAELPLTIIASLITSRKTQFCNWINNYTYLATIPIATIISVKPNGAVVTQNNVCFIRRWRTELHAAIDWWDWTCIEGAKRLNRSQKWGEAWIIKCVYKQPVCSNEDR